LLCLAVVGLAYLFYRFYYQPYSVIKHYVKVFRAKGYKVYKFPFHFMGVPLFDQLLADTHTHKDAIYSFKHTYAGHDMVVGNMMGSPYVGFTNPTLAKELTSLENTMAMPKDLTIFQVMANIAPVSIFSLEK
jgi:hypothetical protein